MVLSSGPSQVLFSNSTHTVTGSVCACEAGGMMHSIVRAVFLIKERKEKQVNGVTSELAMSTTV